MAFLGRVAPPRAALLARRAASALAPSSSSSSWTQPAATVASVAVGDELLDGTVADANTPYLAALAAARGADLVEAAFVRDDVDAIAATVARLSSVADAVVVAGGVGPTHDDVTYAAVAGAAGVARHAATVAAMEAHYAARGVPLHEGRLRMADLPANADAVVATPGTWVPLVRVGRAVVVPGVPALFKAMLAHHADALFRGTPHLTASLLTPVGEGDVAAPLAAVAAGLRGAKVGSYILADDDAARAGGHNVRLRVRSKCATDLEAAVAAVEAAVPGAVREQGG